MEKKTRKLEKLIRKVSEAEREVSDLSSEFQREREEMLDTIRQLARQIKLKDCILEGFAPAHKVKQLEEHQILKLGGMVAKNSFYRKDQGLDVRFQLTDGKESIWVSYHGVLPSLFVHVISTEVPLS